MGMDGLVYLIFLNDVFFVIYQIYHFLVPYHILQGHGPFANPYNHLVTS